VTIQKGLDADSSCRLRRGERPCPPRPLSGKMAFALGGPVLKRACFEIEIQRATIGGFGQDARHIGFFWAFVREDGTGANPEQGRGKRGSTWFFPERLKGRPSLLEGAASKASTKDWILGRPIGRPSGSAFRLAPGHRLKQLLFHRGERIVRIVCVAWVRRVLLKHERDALDWLHFR